MRESRPTVGRSSDYRRHHLTAHISLNHQPWRDEPEICRTDREAEAAIVSRGSRWIMDCPVRLQSTVSRGLGWWLSPLCPSSFPRKSDRNIQTRFWPVFRPTGGAWTWTACLTVALLSSVDLTPLFLDVKCQCSEYHPRLWRNHVLS